MTREEFIKAVNERYGDLYDCSALTDGDLKNQANVQFRCTKHGVFYTTPYQLLHGLFGCYECFREGQETGNDKKGRA